MDLEAVTTWTHVLDAYGESAAMEIYTRVFSPHKVCEREPYPEATEALRRLQEECRIQIHFITRNWDPERIEPHLEPWLREHFGPNVGLTVVTGDKLRILRALGALGMVDDRPETLARVADAGLWAATLLQPWNRDLVVEHPGIHGFASWHEVQDLLPPLP